MLKSFVDSSSANLICCIWSLMSSIANLYQTQGLVAQYKNELHCPGVRYWFINGYIRTLWGVPRQKLSRWNGFYRQYYVFLEFVKGYFNPWSHSNDISIKRFLRFFMWKIRSLCVISSGVLTCLLKRPSKTEAQLLCLSFPTKNEPPYTRIAFQRHPSFYFCTAEPFF